MRGAERAVQEGARPGRFAGRTVDPGRFQRLRRGEGRKYPRHPLRQHRLPAARRPHHEQGVASRRRDFQRAPGHRLAHDVGHVREAPGIWRTGVGRSGVPRDGVLPAAGIRRDLARNDARGLAQGPDGRHPDSGNEAGLFPVEGRRDDSRDPELAREERLREGAADRADASVEGQLPRDQPPSQGLAGEDAFRAQHGQRDGQIEQRPVLAEVGGRQVDGDLPAWKRQSRIPYRRADPVVAFPYRSAGKAYHRVRGEPLRDVRLHFHRDGVDPQHGEGQGADEHGGGLRSERLFSWNGSGKGKSNGRAGRSRRKALPEPVGAAEGLRARVG